MLHLIVNPTSSKGQAEKILAEAEKKLQSEGVEYDVFRSTRRGEIAEHVRSLTEEGEHTLIAVGGDGTLNEVVRGISDPARVILGLIPAGTGNDFAATARIPEGAEAVDLILHSEPKFTDYLECGITRSINIAGLGIDVDILERCERKKHGGAKSKYYRSLLVSLMKYKAMKMKVVVDGEEREHSSLLAAVCNGTMFGGGIPICPPAVLDDGKLDLVIVDCPKRWKLPYYLTLLKKGKILTRSCSHHTLCSSVTIVPERKGNVQYDGELLPAEQLEARIVTDTLRMYRG